MSTTQPQQNVPGQPGADLTTAGDIANLPDGAEFDKGLARRHLRGNIWARYYNIATIFALIALLALFYNIANQAFGYVATRFEIQPSEIVEGGDLDALNNQELAQVLAEYQPRRLPVYIRDTLSQVEPTDFTSLPLSEVLAGRAFDDSLADLTIRELSDEQYVDILANNLSQAQLRSLVQTDVVGEQILEVWTLTESVIDAPSELDAEIILSLPRDAWYSLDASRYQQDDGTTSGGFELSLTGENRLTDEQIANLEVPAECEDAPRLEYGETLTGTVDDDNPHMFFCFTGSAGSSVDIRMHATSGDLDPVLTLTDATSGQEVRTNDDIHRSIDLQIDKEYPDGVKQFRSWISTDFLTNTMSTNSAVAGARTALFGTLWVMVFTLIFAFPLGVGAAIYLEEYATDTWYNRLIETNIRNLAGVPSIIYGLFGLAIFVRALELITQGRTIVSAALTLTLLILPVVIINSQEGIRSVSRALREGSYGLGATKWQTIWRIVLPAAMPGILTGTILSMSRAIGETAPLLVLGASTLILVDPTGPYSRFTVLPIQIYQWTGRPQDSWRSVAAAGIIILLVLLLVLNLTAILMRQYYRRKLQG